MKWRSTLPSLLIAVAGCAQLTTDTIWLLPPHSPPASATVSLAAPSTSSVTVVYSGGELSLAQVLESVAESYPGLTIARRQQIVAEASQLAALGAFDLKLKLLGDWNP